MRERLSSLHGSRPAEEVPRNSHRPLADVIPYPASGTVYFLLTSRTSLDDCWDMSLSESFCIGSGRRTEGTYIFAAELRR